MDFKILFELFYVFFLIGAFTFGGGYAMIQPIKSQVVSRGWMTEIQVDDFVAVSETTPGPFAINMATFVGSTKAGPLGALCATLGVILPSFIIILLLVTILAKFSKSKYLKGATNGVKPIILGLVASTVLLLIVKTFFFNRGSFDTFVFDRSSISLFFILFTFLYIYNKKASKPISMIQMLLISGICGMIVF